MPSPYVLGNTALQYLGSGVPVRFSLTFAVYNTVTLSTTSQDIALDAFGTPTLVNNADLLQLQQEPYAPQVNMGPNRVGFVGEPLRFDGARSAQRGNLAAVGHYWSADGSPTSLVSLPGADGSPTSQAEIVWGTPGLYNVSLSVTDRFGATRTGTRQVRIYQDRPSAPSGVIGFSQLAGSVSGGGWQCSLTTTRKLLGFAGAGDLAPGGGMFVPVVLYGEFSYETTPGSWIQINPAGEMAPLSGQYYRDPRILFAGYVQSATANQTSEYDTITLQLQTPDLLLRQGSIHNIGYYTTSYTSFSGMEPTSQQTSTVGQGQLVSDLTSEDAYRSLLGGHSNFASMHDIYLTRVHLPLATLSSEANTAPWTSGQALTAKDQLLFPTYSTLTANEGTLWDALSLLAQNEYCYTFCDAAGALNITPDPNLHGYELQQTTATRQRFYRWQLLNMASEGASTTVSNQPLFANGWVVAHHLHGTNALPQPQDVAGQVPRDLGVILGAPVVAHLSDIPIPDSALTPPIDAGGHLDGTLLPWVQAGWPQDLSIRPFTTQVNEFYVDHSAFVKLIGTLAVQQTTWSAWYPSSVFSCGGLLQNTVPAGVWDVEQQLLLPDALVAASGASLASAQGAGAVPPSSAVAPLVWQYLWELARRLFYAHNTTYEYVATLGPAPYLHLSDLIHVTRQQVQDGPRLYYRPFCVQQVAHTINLDQQTWVTQVTASEVTSASIGPLPPIPCPLVL